MNNALLHPHNSFDNSQKDVVQGYINQSIWEKIIINFTQKESHLFHISSFLSPNQTKAPFHITQMDPKLQVHASPLYDLHLLSLLNISNQLYF